MEPINLLKGGISVLRLFRAFRVFRLFKRVKALRQIIAGVIESLPGVCNAFVILFLVMGIWSIMACNFFAEKFDREFGNFSKAMLSMFQIMSYDSWSSGITRPVVTTDSDTPTPIKAIFFLSYVFISAIIMSNVVLAILLDKFLAASAKFNKAEEGEAFVALKDTATMFKVFKFSKEGEDVEIVDPSTEWHGVKEGKMDEKWDKVTVGEDPKEAVSYTRDQVENLGYIDMTPIGDILAGFENGMVLQKEHIKDFQEDVMKKLEALDALVQGPLRDAIEAQKDQTLGLQGNSLLRSVSTKLGLSGVMAMFGIGNRKKKLSQVSPA
jgi:hypothetical protein